MEYKWNKKIIIGKRATANTPNKTKFVEHASNLRAYESRPRFTHFHPTNSKGGPTPRASHAANSFESQLPPTFASAMTVAPTNHTSAIKTVSHSLKFKPPPPNRHGTAYIRAGRCLPSLPPSDEYRV